MTKLIHLLLLLGIGPWVWAQQDPTLIVQRQMEAHNAQDLPALMATYADSVEVFLFPNQLVMRGKAVVEQTYRELFRQYPTLYATLLSRIVEGNRVIDHERVTGRGPTPQRAVAIHEVQAGLIRRIWFIQ